MSSRRLPAHVSDAAWASMLALFVGIRTLIPLAVLAAAPSKLPLLPRYRYVPLNGDAYGFYHAVANLFAAFDGVFDGVIGLAALFLLACFSVASLILWRGGIRWAAVLLPAFGVCLIIGVLVRDMAGAGAAVIGWPLLWAAALLPLPILHIPLTPDRAFPAGLTLSLLTNATTIVATALIGLRASGRRSVGLTAAGLLATWPIWVGLIAGHQAWMNGQWNVDVGLHLYDEPLSTALVAVSLVLLLNPRLNAESAAVAGLLLGFATAVKLTDGFIALALVVVIALRDGVRRAAIVALGGAATTPIVIGFWPHGYVNPTNGPFRFSDLYQLRFVSNNLRTSTIFTWTMLLVLVPLAVCGIFFLAGRFPRALLLAPIIATIVCYAAYYVTNQHPRFYYVALPPLFVLQAAGVALVWRLCGRRLIGALTT